MGRARNQMDGRAVPYVRPPTTTPHAFCHPSISLLSFFLSFLLLLNCLLLLCCTLNLHYAHAYLNQTTAPLPLFRYVSEMWNACGITSWQTNSHVVHATSATVVGQVKQQSHRYLANSRGKGWGCHAFHLQCSLKYGIDQLLLCMLTAVCILI